MTPLQRAILLLGAATCALAWLFPDSVLTVPSTESSQFELGRRYRFAPVSREDKAVPELVFRVAEQLKLERLYPSPVPMRMIADGVMILVTTVLLTLAVAPRSRGVPSSRERDTS